MVRSSPPVLSIRTCKSKLDEEKSKHVGLAEETGFGPSLHLLLIGSTGLLKVVSHVFAVPAFVLGAELEKSK